MNTTEILSVKALDLRFRVEGYLPASGDLFLYTSSVGGDEHGNPWARYRVLALAEVRVLSGGRILSPVILIDGQTHVFLDVYCRAQNGYIEPLFLGTEGEWADSLVRADLVAGQAQ